MLLKDIDVTTPTKLKTQMTVTTQSGLWGPKPGTLGGAENTLHLLMSELSLPSPDIFIILLLRVDIFSYLLSYLIII